MRGIFSPVLPAFLLAAVTGAGCLSAGAVTPAGSRALELTRDLTSIGPRPPGSAGIDKVRGWIQAEVSKMGLSLAYDRFTAATPIGPIEMVNLSYVVPGKDRSQRVVLMAHYDSKRFVGFDFVGANDAASSVALLLAVTPGIQKQTPAFDVEVVFVDGEEAIERWSSEDSLYGSRRYASLQKSGKPIRAAIVVDMVGDADLMLVRERDADAKLVRMLEEALSKMGRTELLAAEKESIMDDHTPLIRAGIPTLHLMDFTYGGKRSPGIYWHTSADTADKISAASLSTVGEIILALLKKI